MSEEPSAQTEPDAPQQVRCPAAKDPAVRLFIVSGMALAGGLWCVWDAYIKDSYPYVPMEEDLNAFFSWAFNHFLPALLLPVAIVFGVWGRVFLKRVLVADQDGIGYQGKQKYAWDSVSKLDASDLAEKKIMRLHVEGRPKPLELDAWKLENFKDLVALVEEKVPDERRETG